MTTHLVDVDKTQLILGKPEGVFRNWQSRQIHRTQIDDKENKNTKEKAKNMSKTDLTIILWVDSGCWRRISSSYFLYISCSHQLFLKKCWSNPKHVYRMSNKNNKRLAVIFINILPNVFECDMYVFTDDKKIFNIIKNKKERHKTTSAWFLDKLSQ